MSMTCIYQANLSPIASSGKLVHSVVTIVIYKQLVGQNKERKIWAGKANAGNSGKMVRTCNVKRRRICIFCPINRRRSRVGKGVGHLDHV